MSTQLSRYMLHVQELLSPQGLQEWLCAVPGLRAAVEDAARATDYRVSVATAGPPGVESVGQAVPMPLQGEVKVDGDPGLADGHPSALQAMLDLEAASKGPLPRPAPELLFLGTGSAVPSKYRNATSILLTLPWTTSDAEGGHGATSRYVLLDCGEGTYAQLVRRYGVSGTWCVLRGLQAVVVTHMHVACTTCQLACGVSL